MSAAKEIIKVRVEQEVRAFIHNDVGNAAHFLLTRIRSRIASDDTEGVFLDRMACALMIAFSHEANVNFIGWKVFGVDWPERKPTYEKLKLILEKVDPTMDWSARPLSTLPNLRIVRDALAHGKPRLIEDSEPMEGTYDELYKISQQEHLEDWEKLLTQDFLEAAYADVDEIYGHLLDKAGIELHETLSGRSYGMSTLAE